MGRRSTRRFVATSVTNKTSGVFPAIVDTKLGLFVGFLTELGNDELADEFERNPHSCVAFTWHALNDETEVSA